MYNILLILLHKFDVPHHIFKRPTFLSYLLMLSFQLISHAMRIKNPHFSTRLVFMHDTYTLLFIFLKLFLRTLV